MVHRVGVRTAVVRDHRGELHVFLRVDGVWALDGEPLAPGALLSAMNRAITLASE